VDVRNMYVTAVAGSIGPDLVEAVESRAVVLGTSLRGEVGLETIEGMRRPGRIVAADLQGFVRVLRGTRVEHAPWPERDAVLALLDIIKVDAVEAKFLTGEPDPLAACRGLARMGPGEIVLTHKNGVVVFDHGEIHEVAFYPVRLSEPPATAMLWAAALTSLKMEVLGPFMRTRADVEELLRLRYGYDAAARSLPIH
jgi:sugar/nucleoside kinase (ribokinase family)